MPTAQRNLDGYGTPPIEWERVRDTLAGEAVPVPHTDPASLPSASRCALSPARRTVLGLCCVPTRSPFAQGGHMATGQFHEALGGRRHSTAGPGDEREALLIPRIKRHPCDVGR